MINEDLIAKLHGDNEEQEKIEMEKRRKKREQLMR